MRGSATTTGCLSLGSPAFSDFRPFVRRPRPSLGDGDCSPAPNWRPPRTAGSSSISYSLPPRDGARGAGRREPVPVPTPRAPGCWISPDPSRSARQRSEALGRHCHDRATMRPSRHGPALEATIAARGPGDRATAWRGRCAAAAPPPRSASPRLPAWRSTLGGYTARHDLLAHSCLRVIGWEARHHALCQRCARGDLDKPAGQSGRLAQRESASLTRKRSEVQIL